MYYVYCLKSKIDGKPYYGYTKDLRRRMPEHGEKYWTLVYYEAYLAQEDAVEREKHLKQYGQARTHLKKRITYSWRP